MPTWETGSTITLATSQYKSPSLRFGIEHDLRLGEGGAPVGKVVASVRWLKSMAGLPGA